MGWRCPPSRHGWSTWVAERRTGISDLQWWQAAGPALAEVFDPDRFPVADRVGSNAGQAHQAAYNLEHEYVFGLDRIIEGIAALIHRSSQRSPQAPE